MEQIVKELKMEMSTRKNETAPRSLKARVWTLGIRPLGLTLTEDLHMCSLDAKEEESDTSDQIFYLLDRFGSKLETADDAMIENSIDGVSLIMAHGSTAFQEQDQKSSGDGTGLGIIRRWNRIRNHQKMEQD
eukprot:g32067.t1